MNDDAPDDLGGLRNDERQAKLNEKPGTKRKKLYKPEKIDLRRLHPMSMGRQSSSICSRLPNGMPLNIMGISEAGVTETLKALLKAHGAAVEAPPDPNAPKPGEPAAVMPLKSIEEALVGVGPSEALVEEVINLATKGVITRDHVQYETYQTRFNNATKRCAKALRTNDLLLWSRWVRLDGVNKKRFGVGPTAPTGVEIVEPA